MTFHSFKKGAVTHAYNTNKDIQLARKVGGHSSINTTQTYLADSEEMFQGAISSSKSINSNNINFNDFTKEELVAALMNANESVQLYIKKELIK
ncbi:site-specific integrase [Mammaliicoccus sciuri]|nr:site-specific integrase [Mammaliicoccus sciuri]